MKNKNHKFKIVKVLWQDAQTSEQPIYSLEKIKTLHLADAEIIGYLLDENEDRIVVCGFVFPNEDEKQTEYQYPHIIPKSWIKKIIILKE